MSDNIATQMQAVVLREYNPDSIDLEFTTLETPKPKDGEVLIRIAHSPINPSDLSFLQGQYGIKKKLPCVPGFEASGTVVASGGGDVADALLNKLVAVTAPPMGDGSWAEYMACPASMCIPLQAGIDLEAGSMLVVNPLTAISLVAIAIESKAKAIIQTAAAGALGQMIWRYAKSKNLAVINIVRRPAQVEALQAAGAEHVLDSSDAKFERQLRVLARKLEATVALDAVGGAITGQMAQTMPGGSTIVVYGGLAAAACEIHPGALIFMGQTVRGFWLSSAMYQMEAGQLQQYAQAAQEMLKDDLRSDVRAHFGLAQAQDAIELYQKSMSGGKILISPDGTPAQ